MKRFLGLGEVVKLCPPLYRQINRMRKFRLHEPEVHLAHRFLGSSYGGWGIPEGYLQRESIVYSVGVGEDITFDLALVHRYSCSVFAFDPTPIATKFMNRCKLPDEITFVPIGLSSSDGSTTFFTPLIEGSHSLSKFLLHPELGETPSVTCETLTLASIMKRLGHDRVDLMKIDIEGAEYEVIDEIISSRTLPKCLLVEFHHLFYGFEPQGTSRAVESLRAAGYQIFWVSQLGREYGFILRDEIDTAAAKSYEGAVVRR